MNNPFNAIMQVINGGNPQAFINQQIENNPQLKQQATQIQNMMKSSKMSSKDFAMQYFKQMGIDLNQVQMLAQRMGIK